MVIFETPASAAMASQAGALQPMGKEVAAGRFHDAPPALGVARSTATRGRRFVVVLCHRIYLWT
jgi:hypothetical protein